MDWFGAAAAVVSAVLSLVGAHLIIRQNPACCRAVDALAQTLALTVAILTLSGLLLARMGLWSSPAVALATIMFALFVGIVVAVNRPRDRGAKIVRLREVPSLALAVGIGICFFWLWLLYSHEFIFGERDEGVYIASGIELAKSGNFGWPETVLSVHGFSRGWRFFEFLGVDYDQYPRFLLYPGFYVDEANRWVVPQFLGGYESLIALAYKAGGIAAVMAVNPALMAAGLIAFFAVARHLAGLAPALVATVLAGLSAGVSWHARTPGNEALTLVLTWGLLGQLILSARGNDRFQSSATATTFLLSAALGSSKIAGWFLLPLMALALAMLQVAASGKVLQSARGPVFGLFAAAIIASAHAAGLAPMYFYGSFKHGPEKLGVPYWLVVVGLPLCVFGGGVLGALCGWSIRRLSTGVLRVRFRFYVSLGIFAMLAIVARQMLTIQRRSDLTNPDAIWSNAANLNELANYLPTGLSILGLAGLAWLITARTSAFRVVLAVMGALTLLLVVNRNIDAIHPWAARRWVPLVFPSVCLGAAFVLWQVVVRAPGLRPRVPAFLRLAVFAGCCGVFIFAILRTSNWLLISRHGHGLAEGHAKISKLLPPGAFVLANPSVSVRRWLPYLRANHGIESYVLPAHVEAWSLSMPVLKSVAQDNRPIIFLSDFPPAPWTTHFGYFSELDSTRTLWMQQAEEVRSLPVAGAEWTSASFTAYKLHPKGLRRGWMPWSHPPPEPVVREVDQWPFEVPLNGPIPEFEGIVDGADATGDPSLKGQLWTQRPGRIYLRELVESFRHPDSTETLTHYGYRIELTVSVGPFRTEPVAATIALDNSDLQRRRVLLDRALQPGETTTVSLAVRTASLRDDSAIDFLSRRPQAAPLDPGTRVGLHLKSVVVSPLDGRNGR